MTLGASAWPVLNGGLGLSFMHITQLPGQRNYSLHWRDGHVTGGHPTVFGSMVGNHSTMPAPNTPHFNWGIDFPGTVSASNYSNWATPVKPGEKRVDCTWITFCTSCCPKVRAWTPAATIATTSIIRPALPCLVSYGPAAFICWFH